MRVQQRGPVPRAVPRRGARWREKWCFRSPRRVSFTIVEYLRSRLLYLSASAHRGNAPAVLKPFDFFHLA